MKNRIFMSEWKTRAKGVYESRRDEIIHLPCACPILRGKKRPRRFNLIKTTIRQRLKKRRKEKVEFSADGRKKETKLNSNSVMEIQGYVFLFLP